MPQRFEKLAIPEVLLAHPRVFGDDRGFLLELFKASEFAASGVETPIRQVNHSQSTRGTLRGLHYQRAPKAQAKLVRVVAGEIFDVAVDLRKGSPTYGRVASAVLSAENKRLLVLPEWCAHGFCVTSESADIVYLASNEYAAELEGGVAWDDPELGIEWPVERPVLSARDRALPRLADAETGFLYSP